MRKLIVLRSVSVQGRMRKPGALPNVLVHEAKCFGPWAEVHTSCFMSCFGPGADAQTYSFTWYFGPGANAQTW
jgi:hypothetical protein